MAVQLTIWELIGLFIAFMGCVWGFFKFYADTVEKALNLRFNAIDKSSVQSELKLTERFASFDREIERRIGGFQNERAELRQLTERKLEAIDADIRRMPDQYVRREDWIRLSTAMEARQDRLAEKFDDLKRTLLKQSVA